MTNSRYHILHNIAAQAPPARVILSRLSGGKIGNKSVFEELAEEPAGYDFNYTPMKKESDPVINMIKNQIKKEEGVKGIVPRSESDLEAFIRAWLKGLEYNIENLTLAECLDEISRIGIALFEAGAKYNKAGGPDRKMVPIIEQLAAAYEELNAIKWSLQQDHDDTLLDELDKRRMYTLLSTDPANKKLTDELKSQIDEMALERKLKNIEVADLKQAREVQGLSKQTLEQEWANYLSDVLEELRIGREKFDPTNARDSFRAVLKSYIESSKSSGQDNVSKYLTILQKTLAPIVDAAISAEPDYTELDQLIAQSAGNGSYVQLLTDIRKYYADAWRWKKDATEALAMGKQALENLTSKCQVPGFNIGGLQSLADVFGMLSQVADVLGDKISQLTQSLGQVRQELANSQTAVLKEREMKDLYKQEIDNIASDFLTKDDQDRVQENVRLLRGILNATVRQFGNYAQLEANATAGKQAAEATKAAILGLIYRVLKPYDEFLKLFSNQLNSNKPVTREEAEHVVSILNNTDFSNPMIDQDIRNGISELLKMLSASALQLMVFGNTLINAYRFLNQSRLIVENQSATPDQIIAILQRVKEIMEQYRNRLDSSSSTLDQMTQALQELTAENTNLRSNLAQLQQSSQQEISAQKARVEALQQQLTDQDQTAKQQLEEIRKQLEANQAEVAAAQQKLRSEVSSSMLDDRQLSEQYQEVMRAHLPNITQGNVADLMKVWRAFLDVQWANSELDMTQACHDLLSSFFPNIPGPDSSVRRFSAIANAFFLYVTFAWAPYVRDKGDAGDKTFLGNVVRKNWERFFISKRRNYVSLSVCARIAVRGNLKPGDLFSGRTADDWAQNVIRMYNLAIENSINNVKNPELFSRTTAIYRAPPNIGTMKAYLEEVAVYGGFRGCPDFVFAATIFLNFPTHAVDEFAIWNTKSMLFAKGTDDEWPLLKFLLSTDKNYGLPLLKGTDLNLAAECVFFDANEINAENRDFNREGDPLVSLHWYCINWMIKT